MNVHQPVEIGRALVAAISARDFEAAAELVSHRIVVTVVATGDTYFGPQGFLELARGWSTAFPDLRLTGVRFSGGEEEAAVEYDIHGTHTGPLITPRGHIPPTGMEIQLPCCDVLEVSGGRVAAMRSYFDSATMLRQLGLVAGTPLHAPERRAALEMYAQALDDNAPQRHKAIVQRFLDAVYNRHNPASAADTCRHDFQWHGGPLGEARGLDGYRGVLANLFHAFPDLELQIVDLIAESDRVVARFTWTATHEGDFQGIPATRKRLRGGGTTTFRLEASRIVEEWWQGDLLVALLQQIDAVPSSLRLSP
jgi:steroid delta-isomerase-like uncharacterized protein